MASGDRSVAKKPSVKMRPAHINVLVIGESGAGKSTWINAVANYLKFGSLEEAVQAGGEFPIPFLLKHPQTREKIAVSCDDDSTMAMLQNVESGKSVTQMPNEYVCEFKDTGNKLHLIDTPGLLDTENKDGNDVDKEHVNNILRLLSSYRHIHAICIALKSTVNRLSDALKYTLTEIMKKLDTGAVDNVIFIVTYASGIMFQTGNILDILERFLDENKLNVPLPPTKDSIYCFENGTVNYLAECRNSIPHSEYETDSAQTNWKISQSSTQKMIRYILELQPISVASINAMYNADHTVGVLSELVLEISLCNYKNVATLERKEKEAERLREAIRANPLAFAKDDLKKLLIGKEWKVISKQLRYKNVVCESGKCTRTAVDATVNPRLAESHPQICCQDCKSPWIRTCDKISFLGDCKVCQCERSKHRFKTTEHEMVKVDVPSPDESVIEKVVDSNGALKQLDKTIYEYSRRVERYTNETRQMLSTCAKLNCYVQQNALMASSVTDRLLEKLQSKMLGCETAEEKADKELEYLKIIQNYYHKANAECGDKKYSTSDVGDLIQQMYRLELKGKELKDAMDVEAKARQEVIEKGRNSGVARIISRFN